MNRETFSDEFCLVIEKDGKLHGPFTQETPAAVLAPFIECWSEDSVVVEFDARDPIDPEQPLTGN